MINVKEFVINFDAKNPDWKNVPEGFPKCSLSGLSSPEVGAFNAIRMQFELDHPAKSTARSRVWTDPEGYRFLIPWTNAVLLRLLVRKFTTVLPSFIHPVNSSNIPLNSLKGASEHRLVAQLNDCARSVVANIEEGFKRPTTKEYLEFLGFSQASLEEVKGDIRRSLQDKLLKSDPGSSLTGAGLDLAEWYKWCRNPEHQVSLLSFPLNSSKGGYRNLEEVKGEDITYEMFIELINKTDKLLRTLVESLEKKLADDVRGWEVEKLRVARNAEGRW